MADGHLNKCKSCAKQDVLIHRKENLEKVRAYDNSRASLLHRKEARKNYNKKYADIFPDKIKANTKVHNAIRDGRIIRPNECQACGHPCIPHAHHWSYEEKHWLDVEWLCVVCHMNLHHAIKEPF